MSHALARTLLAAPDLPAFYVDDDVLVPIEGARLYSQEGSESHWARPPETDYLIVGDNL